MLEDQSVKVRIFGTEYTLRGASDSEYVQKVAEFVDKRMREVGENSSVGSTTRIAILAAVNIADELFREQQKRLENLAMLEDRSMQISGLLAKEVGDGQHRFEDGDSLPGT